MQDNKKNEVPLADPLNFPELLEVTRIFPTPNDWDFFTIFELTLLYPKVIVWTTNESKGHVSIICFLFDMPDN